MESNPHIKTWTPATIVMVVLIILGSAVAVYRMLYGLGAATNLNDGYPWGFWLGLDVLGGVAMAAGGFIIACAVYLFNWKKYRPIVRPAILTAFLGYLMAVIALFFDIGHPFRLAHPAVMWQYHSVMWVVAMHVIFYTTTLGLEFSPMLFERLGWNRALKAVNKIMIGAVIFGVMLSTLHQSSLGAVFLIAPSKMSPLWWDTKLPFHFLVSAVAMGLSMVSFETMLSYKFLKHKVDKEVFYGLARGSLIVLSFYLLLKVYQLFAVASPGMAFDGSVEGNMYLLEMLIGVIIPIAVLCVKKYRTNLGIVFSVNMLVIAGVLLNRLNVCLFSMEQYNTWRGVTYGPSWMEFLLSLGIISLGVFLYKMSAKHLPLFSH
ncbi:NrfD/PsrC family molybdoenzyme membrane anchor subunit [Desulfobulbus oligotrophicus]|uniref:Ni/Fe-hydrogenase cytochrome b subunit n=1 Tax=Desulfobulbus oligotrophicus TaxID=1909699 RepID=A0A7T5VAW8_9BACT|nr:Ni/Fe-hydrogenase cytochrome b subunit [Desulfobulbus oligotrophicus]QQG64527.1 Ni/Fe-hydrogenase cytochrome b subunit [Desulfobulbus oligotrophicus]